MSTTGKRRAFGPENAGLYVKYPSAVTRGAIESKDEKPKRRRGLPLVTGCGSRQTSVDDGCINGSHGRSRDFQWCHRMDAPNLGVGQCGALGRNGYPGGQAAGASPEALT